LLFPGVIAAQTIDKTVDIEDGFPEGQVCSYYFGHRNASDNSKMYQKLLGRLAFAVNGRLASMNDERKSGAIIVAPSEVEPFLSSIQDLFQVNVIFVIGSERLHSTIVKSFGNVSMDLSVLKLSLSGGFVKLDSAFRKAEFQRQVRSYFYGRRDEYTPFSNTRSYDSIKMYRLGEDALAPSSALPLGASRKVSETRTVKVEPTQAIILYSILAISWASNEDQLSDVNCAGYIYVTMADDDKKTFTYLCPSPGDLPSSYLIIGDVKWIEK
jgi:polyribonucleotide 5'-hydroxyl-kinase